MPRVNIPSECMTNRKSGNRKVLTALSGWGSWAPESPVVARVVRAGPEWNPGSRLPKTLEGMFAWELLPRRTRVPAGEECEPGAPCTHDCTLERIPSLVSKKQDFLWFGCSQSGGGSHRDHKGSLAADRAQLNSNSENYLSVCSAFLSSVRRPCYPCVCATISPMGGGCGYLKVVLLPSHSGGSGPDFRVVEREWSRIRKPEFSFGSAIHIIPVLLLSGPQFPLL